MVFFSPALLSLIILLLNSLDAFPLVLNILWPAWLSFPHVIFFTLTTIVLWKADIKDASTMPAGQEMLYAE